MQQLIQKVLGKSLHIALHAEHQRQIVLFAALQKFLIVAAGADGNDSETRLQKPLVLQRLCIFSVHRAGIIQRDMLPPGILYQITHGGNFAGNALHRVGADTVFFQKRRKPDLLIIVPDPNHRHCLHAEPAEIAGDIHAASAVVDLCVGAICDNRGISDARRRLNLQHMIHADISAGQYIINLFH